MLCTRSRQTVQDMDVRSLFFLKGTLTPQVCAACISEAQNPKLQTQRLKYEDPEPEQVFGPKLHGCYYLSIPQIPKLLEGITGLGEIELIGAVWGSWG